MRYRYASYPVELPVRYQMQEGDPVTGEGRTLTISRETLHFLCDRTLSPNRRIQVVLGWPAALPDGTGLNLWIRGTIAGCVAGCVEVRVGTYEFRTRRDARRINPLVGKNGAGWETVAAGS
jgi:hypothetical protein